MNLSMCFRRLVALFLIAVALPAQDVIKTSTAEILLDLIVRDKRGRLVKDLNASDILISDGGKQYTATSVRLMKLQPGGAASETPLEAKPKSSTDAFKQLRLVTFLFEPLPRESAKLAKETATELIAKAGGTNVFFNVILARERLKILQPFTTDRAALGKSIQAATLFTGSKDIDDMAKVAVENLKSLSTGPEDLDRPLRGEMPKSTMGQGNTDPTDVVRAQQATVMLNMLSQADSMQRQYSGRVSFNALRAAVRALAPLPGRKTIVYVCRGVTSHPSLSQIFRDLTEAANTAGVSIYGVDATGLEISERTREAAQMLSRAAAASMSARNSSGGEAVTREQVMAFETAEQSAMATPALSWRNSPRQPADSCFLIPTTREKWPNKLPKTSPGYWEATYRPDIESWDGSFHPISVKLQRTNVKVQARKGYFALPPGSQGQVIPFEVPLLAALAPKIPPGDLRFDSTTADLLPAEGGKTRGELSLEIPLERFDSESEPREAVFRMRAAVLALFRDEQGEVVERFSQPVNYQGPLDKLVDAKTGTFHWHRTYVLPPGRYSLEIALQDRISRKLGTNKTIVNVRGLSPDALDLSTVSWVRPEALPPPSGDAPDAASDPLRVNGAALTPHANFKPALAGAETGIPMHLVVHRSLASTHPATLEAQIIHDGEAFAKMPIEVPASKERSAPVVITLPTRELEPGHYDIKFIATQDGKSAEQTLALDLGAAPGYAPKPKPAAITSATAVVDEPTIVLRLTALETSGATLPEAEQQSLVERLRLRAKEWSNSLIDFVCLQITGRFVDKNGKGDFTQADTIREMITYANGKESYDRLVQSNGYNKASETSRGVRSFGEFGGMMRAMMSEQSKSTIRWKGYGQWNGQPMHVFEYRVPQASSLYRLAQEDPYRVFKPSYSGEILAEEDTLHVRRITLTTSEIPEKFPFQQATHEIDYEFQRIGGVSFLLPSHSVMQTRIGKRKVVRSDMQFSNYRKWSSDSYIKFNLGTKP